MSDMKSEIETRVGALSEDMRDHLKHVIYHLVRCYSEDSKEKALVVFGDEDTMKDIVTVNCTPMDAARLLEAVNDTFNFINTKDAPPKEMFN